VVFAIDAVLENIGLYLKVFLYYGEQPLQFGKFPLWWGAINSTTPIILAIVVVILRPYLTGWRVWLVVPLAPAVGAAVNAGCGWITWNAINNTEVPVPLVWAAGCVTVGLTLVLLRLAQALLNQTVRLRAFESADSPVSAAPA
jgi:hypothetical protein